MLNQITPVILTYNEASNIRRTLTAVRWAKRVIVMDSFSNDETQSICNEFDNVDFIQRPFDQHAKQWNAAIQQGVTTTWTLALDADHVISDALIDELKTLAPDQNTHAFWVSFTYKINGRSLRGSLYPPVLSLFRTGMGHYQQDGHTQRLLISGTAETLNHKIAHDDRKPWSRWLQSQRNYAKQEARKLSDTPFSQMPIQDRLRYLGLAPLIVVPYTLFIKGVLLSGWPGLHYTWQRFVAECYLQFARLKK